MSDQPNKPEDQMPEDHQLPKQPKSDREISKDVSEIGKKTPIKRISAWMGILLAVVLLLVALLVAALSTSQGTRLFVDTVSELTGASITYGEGDLIRGLSVKRLEVPLKNQKRIIAENAFIKIGFGSLLGGGRISLSETQVDLIRFIDENTEEKKPFAFNPIDVPVKLNLSDVDLRELRIERANKKTIILNQITANELFFGGSLLEIDNGALAFGSNVQVNQINGDMQFVDFYPINATGELVLPKVAALAPVELDIGGALKSLELTAKTRFMNSELNGTGNLSPLEPGQPLDATVVSDLIRMPQDQARVTLADAVLKLDGPVASMDYQLSGDLALNTFAPGPAQSSGLLTFKGMRVDSLTLDSPDLALSSRGFIDFVNPTRVGLTGQLWSLKLDSLLPPAAIKQIPNINQGDFDLGFYRTAAVLATHVDIQAPEGELTAQLQLPKGDPLKVQAVFDPSAQSQYAQGRYQVELTKTGPQIDLSKIDYSGTAGQLKGRARITTGTPLVISANATFNNFEPQTLLKNSQSQSAQSSTLPIKISGAASLGGVKNGDRLSIDAPKLDLLISNLGGQQPLKLLGQSKITLNTKTSDLSVSYQGQLNTTNKPKGFANLALTKQGAQFLIDRAIYKTQGSGINLSGQVNTASPLSWNLKANLDQLDPSYLLSDYPGSITGTFATRGLWGQTKRRVIIDQLNLRGTLKNKPLIATGSLDANLSGIALDQLDSQNIDAQDLSEANQMLGQFKADNFKLVWGENQITAQAEGQSLKLNAQISTLNQLTSLVSGRLSAYVRMTPGRSSPNILAQVNAQNLRVGSASVSGLQLDADVRALGRENSKIDMSLSQLKLAQFEIDSAELQANGTLSQHIAALSLSRDGTELKANLAGKLGLSPLSYQGALRDGTINYQNLVLKQQKPALINYRSKPLSLTLSAHCWSTEAGGYLCLDDALTFDPKGLKAAVSVKELSANLLAPFMPGEIAWDGSLSGNAKVQIKKGQDPQINAVVYTDNGRIGIRPVDPQDDPTQIQYQRLSLIARTQPEGLSVRLDAKTSGSGSGYVDVVIDPKSADKNVNGALVLDDINLSIFRPFIPSLRSISGTASLAAGLSGPLKGPMIYGEFKLVDGGVELIDLPVNLSNIQLTSSIRGNKANLKGSFNSGDGTGNLTGNLNWAEGLKVNAKLVGKKLSVRQPPLLYAEINPTITLEADVPAQLAKIKGVVDVTEATIRPAGANGDPIGLSPDVRVIDRRIVNQPQQMPKTNWTLFTDIDVNLVKDIMFKGFGAEIPLEGSITLTQNGTPTIYNNGQIRAATQNTIEVFGQDLELAEAQINFKGPVGIPSLEVTALRRIDGRRVGVNVTGQANDPMINVFNDAGLTEQQAMNALLTGRINDGAQVSTTGFQERVSSTVAAAGLSAGLQPTRELTNKIGRTFGLESLVVDASGSDTDANVNITGYITPDLYLRYGVGVFTPVDKLTLRYQLTRRVYVEATSSIERAIDVFYNWSF